jgi:hypothetical protein
MSADFELRAALRAERLIVRTPPAGPGMVAENAAVARRDRRVGLPERLLRGGRHAHVAVETEVLGALSELPSGPARP